MVKRSFSVLLALLLLLSVLPFSAFAADASAPVSITNGYLTYTLNPETGGFSIQTADGHPYKQYDNDMPLLYKDDRSNSDETSYVTVRINGKDYIFGRDYGLFGIDTTLSTPVVSNDGRLITTVWTIKGYTVTQQVALSLDENADLTGSVGVAYSVANKSGKDGQVGIRVLLDTALSNSIDAPYVLADTETVPNVMEHEYSVAAGNMPQQLRAMDSTTNLTKASYLFFRGWNTADSGADRVVVGHWANLANTRYQYAPDAACDFTNYSNVYRVPDAAYGIYWTEQTLAAGAVRNAEFLYGVGSFSTDTLSDKLGIDVLCGRVELNDAKTAYKTNELNLTVNLDNSLDNSVTLTSVTVTVTTEQTTDLLGQKTDDGIHVVGQAVQTIALNKGEAQQLSFKLQVDEQPTVTSRRYYVSIDATDAEGNNISDSVSRYVLIPGVSGKIPTVQFNDVQASTIYISGKRGVTISGDVEALRALKASDGWSLYLEPDAGGAPCLLQKKDISFLEDAVTGKLYAISFTTEAELAVGKYSIVFRLTDRALIDQLGTSEIRVGKKLEVSADEKYKKTSYGVLAMVRYDTSKYCFVTFTTEQEYQNFMNGKATASFKGTDGSSGGVLSAHDYAHSYKKSGGSSIVDTEVLLTVRGNIIEMTKTVGGEEIVYYQAEAKDAPVTINNMLEYQSDNPLTIECAGNLSGSASSTYGISGDGTLKVIDSITVWQYEWSITAMNGKVYTLCPDQTRREQNATQLQVDLEGAAFLIQSVGGFLVDLKYGLLTGDYDDDGGITHGVSFGGSISIPIKSPEKKEEPKGDPDPDDYSDILNDMFDEEKAKEDNLHKDTHFSDGNLAAEVNSVLFGESDYNEAEKKFDTGFIGIDASLELSLPKDVLGDLIKNLGGAYAKVVINTIDNYYELSAGLKIKVIECSGTLAFKETEVKGKDVIVPDKIEFYVEDGLYVPIAPPLFMTGVGGGISNLADTIGGEFTKLPPITLNLFTRLALFERMIGDFTLTASLSGLDLNGDFKIKNAEKVMSFKAGISARWIDPWHLNLNGNISVIDGLLTGTLSVILSDDLFYGYACVAVCIPDSIPVVGGKELAALEGAVSNKFIGVNIKIIGISFGCIYYWSGDFDFGKGINLTPAGLSELDALQVVTGMTADGGEYVGVYGTNVHRLASSGSALSLQAESKQMEITLTNPAAQDALLFDFSQNGVIAPDVADLTFTVDGRSIPLTPDDGNGGGNCIIQTLDDGNHIYITITDKSLMAANSTWKLTLADEATGNLTGVTVSGVDDIPALASTAAALNGFVLDVSWAWENNRPLTDGYVDIYVTENADAIARAQNGDKNALGTRLAHEDASTLSGANHLDVTIPASFASGNYYVLTMCSSAATGVTYAMTAQPVRFVNPNLPQAVKSAKLEPAGNGEFYLGIADAGTEIDYTHYVVELQPRDSSISVSNNVMEWGVGETIVFGSTMDLIPGQEYRAAVRTLRETEDGSFYYGETTVYSDYAVLPEVAAPELLSIQSNITDSVTSRDTLEVTYTFDRPVFLKVLVNNEPTILNRKDAAGRVLPDTSFTFTRSLNDGEYIVDFEAVSASTGDSVTGSSLYAAGSEDALLAFTVDTSAPFLALDSHVFFAAADGSYTVTGISNENADVTASEGTVTRNGSGSFSVSGTLPGVLSGEIIIRAADSHGNVTEQVANILSADTKIDRLGLRVNGADVAEGDTVELEEYDSASLTVYAVTSEGNEVSLDPIDVTWNILCERNVVVLTEAPDQVYLTALQAGETAISVSFGSAQMDSDAHINSGTETYVYVNVGKSTKRAAPTGLTVRNAGSASASNGAILGTTTAMEYSTDPSFASAVTCGSGSTEGLPAGTYYVRYKETALERASDYAVIEIPYDTYTIVVEEETDSSSGEATGGSDAHGRVLIETVETADGSLTTVTVLPDDGYLIDRVYVNGVEQTPIHGVFTIENMPEGTEITATFTSKTPLSGWVNPFEDVKESDWFYENVWYATVSRWVNGVSETRFAPGDTLTRAMFVTMLYRLALQPEAGTAPFADVPAGSWYEAPVAWASSTGVVNGVSETEFAPERNITREQMAAILYRFALAKGCALSLGDQGEIGSFADVDDISDYAVEAMRWAVSVGLFKGYEDNTLKPQATATRAEAVTVLRRAEALLTAD